MEKKYLRINRDEFNEYKIVWDINCGKLVISIDEEQYIIDDSLKAIYYRAPVYIRYYAKSTREEQLYKSQWMAFIKNLMYFDKAFWINNPSATYKAENKMLQLKYAKEVGFVIPKTRVINSMCTELADNKNYVIKSIDTLLLRYEHKEAFFYTNILNGRDINSSELAFAPIVVQEFLNPKIDIRVTVVGRKVYAAQILKAGNGIYGDWRKQKDDVEFKKYNLPLDIEHKCVVMLEKLNLSYGGIDLAIANGMIYFIEINPTGEWAWLIENPGFDIDKELTKLLVGSK